MATVYLARSPESKVPVALKILTLPGADLEDDPQKTLDLPTSLALERFWREARIMQSLDCNRVVRVFDTGTEGGRPYLVMEYLVGGDLQTRIGDGLSPLTALRVLREVAEALTYAHSVGVIHRDVKPANVLFREDGSAVLTDFGIARLVSDPSITTTGTVVGSPCYSSPEQVDGQSVDRRSDIYNLGLLLYEMLTGRRALLGDTPVQVILRQLKEPVPRLKPAQAPLQPLLDRLLAKRVDERFPSCEQLFMALDKLITRLEEAGGEWDRPVVMSATDRTIDNCRVGLLEDLSCDRLILPSLPASSARIRAVASAPDASVQQIADAVASEPSLSAQLMRLANGALYGGGVVVRDLRSAILRLGTRAIQHVVMLLLVSRVFDESVPANMRRRLGKAWNKSLDIAFTAEVMAEHLGSCEPVEASLAGLVADVGTLPILAWAVDVPHLRDTASLLDEVVQQLRPELGRAMLERWDYPEEFLDVASTTPQTVAAMPDDLASIVNCARVLIARRK